MALGDSLEEGGLSDVCKADLKESQRKACVRARSVGRGFKSSQFHSSSCCQDGPGGSSPP